MKGVSGAWMSRNLAVVLIILALPGCNTFSPRPDPSRFFTLTPLSQAEETAAKDLRGAAGFSLGIGPIKLPGYLDRQEIVTRSGQNRFDISEYDRWAEPLDENFARVLAQNLSALLRAERISVYPWPLHKRPNYQVEIEVLRFEANAAQDVRLDARWAVLDGNKKHLMQYRESRLARSTNGRSTEAAVAALSEALGDLSREIAGVVSAIEEKKKVTSR
jgi:uncharacterized lipoprotein YmbA